MRFKRLIVLVLTVACLLTCFTATASAETKSTSSINYDIAPMYNIATRVSSYLNFIGTKAECVSQGDGLDTVKISVVQILQRYSGWLWVWDDVALWTKMQESGSIYVYNTKSGLPSGTYRLKSEFTLKNSRGETETITIYSEKVKI